jgi:hypothetical protein
MATARFFKKILHFDGRHLEFCRHFIFYHKLLFAYSSFMFQLKMCKKLDSYIQNYDHDSSRYEVSSFRSTVSRSLTDTFGSGHFYVDIPDWNIQYGISR